ncbi:MAG: TlpA family protein disulfide reductase, partial [bacterium]|nr:TlpA family protein disulfide reductase [bacterium]
ILTGEQYELLEKEKRFYEIIETMKVTVGLGKQAKNFQVKLLSGEFFNLYRQKGKVILIDFWATWCDACIRDKRGLKQTYDFFKVKGFDILSISLDTNEDRLKELVKRFKMDWKHAVSAKGWDDPTVKRYGINSLPSYWLIDKNSVLRAFDLKGKSLQNAIIDLLKE